MTSWLSVSTAIQLPSIMINDNLSHLRLYSALYSIVGLGCLFSLGHSTLSKLYWLGGLTHRGNTTRTTIGSVLGLI